MLLACILKFLMYTLNLYLRFVLFYKGLKRINVSASKYIIDSLVIKDATRESFSSDVHKPIVITRMILY